MKKLVYKGIVFDDFVVENEGVWAEMCEECAKKYAHLISGELDDGGTACGCCSVEGCERNGYAPNSVHYYVDFDKDKVEWINDETDED